MLNQRLVVAAFASALSVKIRTNQLSVEGRAKAAGLFRGLMADSLTTVPFKCDHFWIAARFADQYELGLRSGDALHIAVAADQGATICTLNKRFATAVTALGVAPI
jgi:predicted nucleic acid-binding protein